MKHTWTRTQPTVDLDDAQLEEVLRAVIPAARVRGSRQVATGLVNTIYRVELASGPPVCVKLGQRGVAPAAVEHAVTVQVADLAPVPRPLGHLHADPVTGHPCTVSAWVEGQRLDVLAADLSPAGREAALVEMAGILARVHRVRFDRTGNLVLRNGALVVGEPFAVDAAGLCAYAERCIGDGRGAERLGIERARALLDWLAAHAGALDRAGGPVCLCHGDFGPENVLLDDGLWVLDWEFACAGTPLLDLGHLLRTPLVPDQAALLATAYRAAGGELPTDWERLARMVDLFAWLSFLERDALGPDVVLAARARVDVLLREP